MSLEHITLFRAASLFADCRHKITEMIDHRAGWQMDNQQVTWHAALVRTSPSVLFVGFALGYSTHARISHGPPTDNVRRRAF